MAGRSAARQTRSERHQTEPAARRSVAENELREDELPYVAVEDQDGPIRREIRNRWVVTPACTACASSRM